MSSYGNKMSNQYTAPWTEQEDEIVRELYPSVGVRIPELERTTEAIQHRAIKLGVTINRDDNKFLARNGWEWDKWEDDIIRDDYPYYGTLLSGIWRTKTAIARRASYLGVNYEAKFHRWRELNESP